MGASSPNWNVQITSNREFFRFFLSQQTASYGDSAAAHSAANCPASELRFQKDPMLNQRLSIVCIVPVALMACLTASGHQSDAVLGECGTVCGSSQGTGSGTLLTSSPYVVSDPTCESNQLICSKARTNWRAAAGLPHTLRHSCVGCGNRRGAVLSSWARQRRRQVHEAAP